MCKNMMIAGIKPEIADKKLWDFMIAAQEFMNAYDSHGLGYVAQDAEGKLWGERWLNPADSWKYRKVWTEKDTELRNKFKDAFKGEPRYNKFGVSNPTETVAVLYHARMATCEKGLHNVHPFIRDNTGLIHNGVIRNTHELKMINSTCDSECILNSYVDNGVSKAPDAITQVGKDLRGYYACGVLTQDENGRGVMDIFRGGSAQLYMVYVPELETVVYCTNTDIIKSACKKLGWKTGSTFRFDDEVMLRVDAKTGDPISTHKFKYHTEYGNHTNYNNWRGEDWSNPRHTPTTNTTTTDEKKSSLALLPGGRTDQEVATSRTGVMSNLPRSGNAHSTSRTDGMGCTKIDACATDPYYWDGDGYPKRQFDF